MVTMKSASTVFAFFLRTSLNVPAVNEGRPTLTEVAVTFPTPTVDVPNVALVVAPRFVPVTINGPVGPKSLTSVICCASTAEAMQTVSAKARTNLILNAPPRPDGQCCAGRSTRWAGRRRLS
jgi:hypothetical protein